MSQLEDRLAALSPEKRVLFEKLLQEAGAAQTAFPLSVMQQGIWFYEQLRPGNPAYVVPAAVRLRGQPDAALLRRCVNEVVRRHESLRTTFRIRDGSPQQLVARELVLDLPETDLRGADGRAFAGDLDEAIAAHVGGPFDLARGPLLRLALLRTAADEYVLAVAMHHLVSDGWSVGVLLSELSALYAAYAAGRPSPLPEPKIQYGDFAAWQQRELRAENLREHLEYWRTHLAGAPDALALPTDRPRPAVQGLRGAAQHVDLAAPLMRELTELGRRHGATAYMVLLAVFQVLLHRCCGQDDVVVGVPTANRDRAELEPLIGFFVNTLPVRTRLDADPDFATVLRQVRDACLGLYAHQQAPFERIVEELNPPRDLSRPRVFQACFSYQADPVTASSMAGIELERLQVQNHGSRFDLELQSFDADGALSGWFEYDRDLFDAPTIERMARRFQRLAQCVADRPDLPVSRLDLLEEPERARIDAAGRGPLRQWPDAGWVHECFEQWARRTPQAEAVRFEGSAVSYGRLNERANRLAHRLRRLGVNRDTVVGVCMHRSTQMVVSLLAVLKAGGAYLPLDPDLPRARLQHMLAEAKVPVLLTQRAVLDAPPAEHCAALCVEELEAELSGEPVADPGVPVDGEDLAYVIYTSGSTGAPKGVMNVHAAIRNRLLWMQDAYRLGPGDRVLQKTPYSFDVSVWEFFWPLMTGATLVVARPDGHRDPRYLAQTIRAEGITTVHFVPSMLQAFLSAPDVEQCTNLRRVICSGEALPRELQELFFSRCDAELHNLYGPTEAAIDVTAWACRRDGDPRPVPIGHPIANTLIRVLDRRLQPVPIGVPGELHIGGRNLARGYLGKPGLTAERFIADPLDRSPGARLYKTGDLARLREDGALEYLGRLDHQVKLRGFRIEPGEIESVLRQHPRVREALVMPHGASPQQRLVAYLTADDQPVISELIGFAKQRLPHYMVPSSFVVLPRFPLTPSGKVDRRALPEPDTARPELATRYAAPRDGLERRIAAMWCDLLGVERTGRDDNFFDLGGQSLLMAQVHTRLEAMGYRVSLVELFQYPTIASLAAHLSPDATAPAPPAAGSERAESRRRSTPQRDQAAARRMNSRNGR
ncbi:amino acid adenylation domain-containing protein [Actinocrinis puniceicyclus]|uniref:Amino acid adenylation domain-containing protein n=1 Tax=Actinocrinis puniceicyclus TaxID=977794 RepID=A0A8J7WNA4_9ACTN|nr:non-ribosomal peptide synthetase [Actinocrinis puniceicyclus]MBS2962969.1 amino acid adenylation domain-containing protein [Actinocrinis puniceicyclus]